MTSLESVRPSSRNDHSFKFNRILVGDAQTLMDTIPQNSIDLSFWSPPYHVGKSYEKSQTFLDWKNMISRIISQHTRVLRPGCFMVVNIGDILCFQDSDIPRFQANNMRGKKINVTRNDILAAKQKHPGMNRYDLAYLLGCSEQTIQRRLEHNNVRGGKSSPPTKILLTGSMLADMAEKCGLYLYDKRIWHKDPCWTNSQWHSVSYRAVDEFEHIYIFWKPGITNYDRNRIESEEWAEWGSRGVWKIKSVRNNSRHDAEFPEQLAERVIKLFSPHDGTVLDPFVGTGTTITVAKKLGRKWLGIDINPKYVQMALDRTHES